MNERYRQREVCGRSNRTIVAAARTAHAVLMRSAQKKQIFAPVARASCERCIASYIAAPHFRCLAEASDNRCRDAARPSRGRGSFRGGGTPPRNDFTHSRQWAGMRFSFFYKRKRELTSIQKAVADRQLHGKTMRGRENTAAAEKWRNK